MNHLGAELPFKFVDSTYSMGRKPVLGIKDWVLRILILVVQIVILILERILDMGKEKAALFNGRRRPQKKWT